MATDRPELTFPPYRIDPLDQRLFKDDTPIALRPKTFALLLYLCERRGQLLTKRALLDAVWPDVAVGDDVLKGCIRELREVLDDDAAAPRFIETAHRLGYRFIAPAAVVSPSAPGHSSAPAADSACFVGREAELLQLERALGAALAGARQVTFVVGEAGSGKTSLIAAFVAQARSRVGSVVIGQCIDQFGAGEPYLPVLEALTHLARAEPAATAVLDANVPRWKGAHPSSSPSAPVSSMLRELADALDALAGESGLLLVLEDLHWSDPSTLALISLLATRAPPTKLSIVGTYRPDDSAREHSALRALTQELIVRGRAREVALRGLEPAQIASFLCQRMGAPATNEELAPLLYVRTAGHPMFVARVVEDFVRRGWLQVQAEVVQLATSSEQAALAIPDGLGPLILHHLQRLPVAQRRVLSVLAVAAMPLEAQALAELLAEDVLAVEESCEALCQAPRALTRKRRQDGRTTYALVHSLFLDVTYGELPEERRSHWHGRVARHLAWHAAGRDDVSHALALHFERARDPANAATHYALAAQHAAVRFAPSESLALATRGLELLPLVPEPGPSTTTELRLVLARGNALIALEGFGAQELARIFEHARALADQVDDEQHRAHALLGLRAYYAMRDLNMASRIAREVIAIGERTGDAWLVKEGHAAAGMAAFYRGELDGAEDHYAKADAAAQQLLDRGVERELLGFGASFARRSLVTMLQGNPERARQQSRASLAEVNERMAPFERAWIHVFAAWLHILLREPDPVIALAERACEISERDGFRYWLAAGRVALGVGLAQCGDVTIGLQQMQAGLEMWRLIGAQVLHPYFISMMASTLADEGELPQALAALRSAAEVAAQTGETLMRSELLRLEALWLPAEERALSRALLDQAASLAASQGARTLELRVLTSRAVVARNAGTAQEQRAARRALEACVATFAESASWRDLDEARAHLA